MTSLQHTSLRLLDLILAPLVDLGERKEKVMDFGGISRACFGCVLFFLGSYKHGVGAKVSEWFYVKLAIEAGDGREGS